MYKNLYLILPYHQTMDYSKLRELLAQGKWKEADEETARVMFVVAEREDWGWFSARSIDNFPSEDLRTID